MIWQDTPGTDASLRDRLADRLLREIPAHCGNPALVESTTLTEAAAGVAAYLDQQQTFPHEVTPQAACTLVSRALDAAGEAGLADRIRIFGSALVYPDVWVVTGEETVWVLDAGQLLAPPDPRVEIVLFDRLRSKLTTFADVWDHPRGKGVLGLKGLFRAAAAVLGARAPESRVRRLAGELHRMGSLQLDVLRVQRRWQHTPFVLSLDL